MCSKSCSPSVKLTLKPDKTEGQKMFEISPEYMELGLKLLLATFLSGLVGLERELGT